MRLAIPIVRRGSTAGNVSSSTAAAPSSNDRDGAGLVLMVPARREYEAQGWQQAMSDDATLALPLLLMVDSCLLVGSLFQFCTDSSSLTSILLTTIFGFCSVVLGMFAYRRRWPRVLGLFAVTELVQFFVNALRTKTSTTQCMRVALLPLLVYQGLSFRQQCMPLTFITHGRGRAA